jgi:predicted DNA-binding protein YlxM (UPF0122 family)
MFRNLLSNSSQVKLQLIESLLNDRQCFISDLLTEFDITHSLFKKYVMEINHDLPFLQVTTDHHSCVRLEFRSFASLADVYSYFLSESSAFNLLELLFSSNFSSYETLATELNLSKSSIIRLIKQINIVIQPYEFHIDKKPIRISGNELNIRQFYMIFFLEKYQHEFRDASKNQEQEFLKVAQLMAELMPLKLYFSDIRRIAFLIYVHTRRERMRATEIHYDTIEYFLEKIDLNEFSQYRRAYLEKVAGYLLTHICADLQVHNQMKEEFYQVTKKLFQKFHYTEKDYLTKLETVTFQYLVEINLKVPYCILNDRLNRFVKNCNRVQQVINQDIIELISNSNLPVTRSATINHLIYLFHTTFPLFTEQMIHQHSNFHLALFFDTNNEHTEMVRSQITQFIPHEITITVLNPLDSFFLTMEDESYDLIIGNIVPVSKKVPFKASDMFITPQEISYISTKIEEKTIEQLKSLS